MAEPNPFDQFDTAQTSAPPPNAFDQFDTPHHPLRITIGPKPLPLNGGAPGGTAGGTAPPDTAPAPPVIGAGDAFATALKQGASANFSDELGGLTAAAGGPKSFGGSPLARVAGEVAQPLIGAARLAYEHLTGQPGEATKAYNDAVDQIRQHQQQAQEQQPVASDIGYGGGAIASALLPLGTLGAVAKGAPMGARMLAGARMGGAYGAISGAGEGEGAEDSALRGVVGGVVGMGAGAIAPPILSGIGATAKFVGNRVGSFLGHPIQALQAAKNIDQAATQRAAELLKYDAANTSGGLTGPQAVAAHQAGQPIALMDFGNEATREGARAAANQSPAASAVLKDTVNTRFAEQGKRVSDFVRGLVPGGGNATRTQEALDAAQVAANKPAYARAYRAGDRPVMSPELERLMGSPDVMSAMKTAAEKGKSRAIADGFGAFNSGVKVTEDGRVIFNKGKNGVPTYPNIQFWDYTYRALRDAGNAAYRAGRNDEGSYLSSLSKQLRSELDNHVPEYGQARAGAAALFGAENALEAGQKFVGMRGSLEQARGAINKMSAPERALFAEGFASELADKVSKIADNRNVTIDRIFNSPDGKARINLALGPNRAGELEMFLRREDIMDLARKAVTGNSTTARQLIMQKLANAGAHGAVGAGIGASVDELLKGELDWKHVMLGGMLAGTGVATTAVNAKLAQAIAEKLASDDPKVWREVLRMAANNPKVADTVKRGEAFLEKLVGGTSGNHPMLPTTGAIPATADQQQQQ